ncbi:HK97 family phage major capsid protein [Rhizobium sp. SG_E_25_P2]|uniref:phage major capsid protein n=1 Tax=Rhizobium sp. SG_E_25_P2 TaxID=2879942 RepID=UPI00247441BA|nr:phage major capsid protein [Rhizobium sp. SG_E_25_P2]MDH6265359.1 HK97 family phage major capsid protein [Rhizobium sp. SG_E_25_P2]
MTIHLNEADAERAGIPISDEMKGLIRQREDLVAEARQALDTLNEENIGVAKVRGVEKRHDEIIEAIDKIDAKLDRHIKTEVRSSKGGSGVSRRPGLTQKIEGRATDDGEYTYTDDGGAALENREVNVAYALRSSQSMVDFTRRRATDGGPRDEYRGLSEGALLCAMVTGGRNDIERRALSEGSDSAGGYTVPTLLSARMIDRLRSKAVVFRAGAQTVPLFSDNQQIAKVATDPVPGWRSENGSVAESEPTFTNVTLTPRSLMVMVKVSRELLEDSLNVENVLPDVIASAMALELDRVALMGTGVAPQPKGVKNFGALTTGISVNDNLRYVDLVRARTALRTVNSDVTAYIMSPRDEGILAESVDGTGQPLRIPPAIENIPQLTTTSIPANLGTATNESFVIAGDWAKLIVGIRSSLRVEVLRERFADNHQYAFVAHLRADIAAEHEKAFTLLTGTQPVA